MSTKQPPATTATSNFIREQVLADNGSSKFGGRVCTRFPPEPNGYLHVGHAKAICIDFGLAREFGGSCNLRFDDTNPTTEDVEYVESIQADIRWLGFQWDNLYYASDYFEQLYEYAEKLIQKGVAYVDSLNEEEIREYRGNYYKKGKESPYRNRTVDENLDLFRRMRKGEFKEGEHVLRAKIDLSSQNMNLRDPLLYRIRYAAHHRTGTRWCIYPLYDYAHPLSDAIEKITHSICTLEFEAHRPLYDWCIREAGAFPSQQIEFARGNLTYTVMSKRKLLELVQGQARRRLGRSAHADARRHAAARLHARGDPRLLGARGRGQGRLHGRRRSARAHAARRSQPALQARDGGAATAQGGHRELPGRRDARAGGAAASGGSVARHAQAPVFARALRRARRLPRGRAQGVVPPGAGARGAPALRGARHLRRRAEGRARRGRPSCAAPWIPQSWGGTSPDGRVVRGTLHWVSAAHAVDAEVRLYDRLFSVENPGTTEGKSFLEELNPDSLVRVQAKLEPWLGTARPGETVQFERLGYFRH